MGSNWIPLYCAVMGLLIVGLVVYVLIKHWQRRHQGRLTAKANASKTLAFNGSPRTVTCGGGGPVQPLLQKDANDHMPSQIRRLSASSLQTPKETAMKGPQHVNLGNELMSAATSTRRFREVDEEVKRRMEIALTSAQPSTGNWKQLAIQLGE